MPDICIGSDPEFTIADRNSIMIPASEFFKGCKSCNPCENCEMKRCDEECSSYYGDRDDCEYCSSCRSDPQDCERCEECTEDLLSTPIGIDGYHVIGELRPTESTDPLEHHKNIQELIYEIDLPKDYKLFAGTVFDANAMGGHIHIGYPTINDHWRFANYLSKYCGIPLRKIEDPNELKFRGSTEYGYGAFNSYEIKEYGLEFRMPASWLVSSEIAKSALCLAYVVASEYLNSDTKKYRPMSLERYFLVMKEDNIDNILNHIRTMGSFSTYESEIEPLLSMVEEHLVWNTKQNFQELW